MRIVVDAMGSDQCPIPDVAGTLLAAEAFQNAPVALVLVGDQARIHAELAKHPRGHASKRVEVVHAPEAVLMTDKPSVVGKLKPQSSMHIGMNLVKTGQADAFVTMGNTGAAHAIAMLFTLRRIPGVKRPALSVIFQIHGKPIIFLDIGANADCKPDWLLQFAAMGAVYAQHAIGLENPRIGLLSNGEEEGKGSQLIHDTAALLHQAPLNFIGNVEPTDLFRLNTDVLVSDGFSGNILVKTFEGATRYLGGLIREEIKSSPLSALGGLLIRPAMGRVRRQIDTFEIGGAPLLGVQGVVIIGHGSSNAIAVKNAILQARKAVEGQVILAIEQKIAALPASSADER
jgi:glycerol-3-phosphate acyltransferase PlsX